VSEIVSVKRPCLHLGCGIEKLDGAVNHDLDLHAPHVDVAHDLDVTPWPWDDGSFASIVALDVVEHLRADVSVWLDECWRILRPGGLLYVRVPLYTHQNAFTDPTHRRFFTPHSFDYWDKRTELHRKYGCYYYVRSSRWWVVEVLSVDENILFQLRRDDAPTT
jgi:SAM-dependent methyltransferase